MADLTHGQADPRETNPGGPEADERRSSSGMVLDDTRAVSSAVEHALPPSGSSATSPSQRSEAETRLKELVAQIRVLAPLVSPESLQTAATELQEAAVSPSPDSHWLRPPLQLFSGSPSGSDAPDRPSLGPSGDERSEAGGSIGALAAGGSEASSRSEQSEAAPVWVDGVGGSQTMGPLDLDDAPWAGAEYLHGAGGAAYVPPPDSGTERPNVADGTCGACDESTSVASEEAAAPRRRGRGGKPEKSSWQDGRGLAHGRPCICDACELGAAADGCMALDMMQQPKVADVVRQHTKRLSRPRGLTRDPDRREARYAMYKAFVQWHWRDPLGAECRVRLPGCVVRRIRRTFPNPVCGLGCDFWTGCEQASHYTGFRTAEESRRVREGDFASVDIR
jgi:hypothetical protein